MQKIYNYKKAIVLVSLWMLANVGLKAQIKPQDAILQLQRGINIGNTLDAPEGETSWGNPLIQDYYFDDYKAAGITCVRIPVTWQNHLSLTSPYAIDSAFLARVEQIVDWGLARGLFIILNAMHDGFIKDGYTAENKARFDSLWSQISTKFKGKSDHLLFEILNEPNPLAANYLDDINARILGIIRKNNPTRLVVYSGSSYSSCDNLIAAKVPLAGADSFLIANFHSYSPWNFVSGNNYPVWGTQSEKNAIKAEFDKVYNAFKSKNIPVMVNEYGCPNARDYNSRMAHYACYVENALNHGMAFVAWDDNGSFQIYSRQLPENHQLNGKWDEDVLTIINKSTDQSPGSIVLKSTDTSKITITWANRATNYDSIFVEKRINDSVYFRIAALLPNSTSLVDTLVTHSNFYYYRVIAHYNIGKDYYSYPQRIKIKNPHLARAPYNDTIPQIPGIVQAENFDIGDEGLSYHDNSPSNQGGVYRLNEPVDIEKRDEGGYHLSYLEVGEWTEYTIHVTKAANYKISTYTASQDGGGSFNFQFANGKTGNVKALKTGNWQTNAIESTTFALDSGVQIMRINIVSTPSFNIDKMLFEVDSTSGVKSLVINNITVHPNPASNLVQFSGLNISNNFTVSIFDLQGKMVLTKTMQPDQHLNIEKLANGTYLFKLQADKQLCSGKLIVNKLQ